MTVLIRYCIKITIKLSGCPVCHQIILDIDVAFAFFSFCFYLWISKPCYQLCESTITSAFFELLQTVNGVSEWLKDRIVFEEDCENPKLSKYPLAGWSFTCLKKKKKRASGCMTTVPFNASYSPNSSIFSQLDLKLWIMPLPLCII